MYSIVFLNVDWNRDIWGIRAIVPVSILNFIGLVMCYSGEIILSGSVPDVALWRGDKEIYRTI